MLAKLIYTPSGLLSLTAQLSPTPILIAGFLAKNLPPSEETYGGCDESGMSELYGALSMGRDAFVQDHASGPHQAQLIWHEKSQQLTLGADGESAVIHLSATERENLKSFLLNVLWHPSVTHHS